MCCVIMFSALENAAPSAKRIVIMRQSGQRDPRRDRRSAGWLDLVLVLPPARRAHPLWVDAKLRILTEVGRRGPDASGDRAQGVEIEVVAAGGRLAQQLPGVLPRNAAEVAAQAFLGGWPRALRVRVVGPPHDDVATQNVTAAYLLLRHGGGADEDVLPEIVRGQLGDLPLQQCGHLLGCVATPHV